MIRLLLLLLLTPCAAGLVSLPPLVERQVLQRDFGGHKTLLRLQGTAHPAVDSLEIRLLDSAGVDVAQARRLKPALGAYTDSLRIPEGGWYRLQFRAYAACGSLLETQETPRFGVGMLILAIGQSNMSGRGLGPYKPAHDLASLYQMDSGWMHLSDPYDRGGKPGMVDYDDRWPSYSMIPALVNTLIQGTGVPVGILPAAKGSTFMVDWSVAWSNRNESDHADRSTLYGNSLAKARAVGGVEAIIMFQGEKDVGVSSYAVYKAGFERMAAHYREDLWRSVPIFYGEIGNITNAPDTAREAIQQAQRDLQTYRLNILAASGKTLAVETDSVHYNPASLDCLGVKFGDAILRYLGK